MTTTRREVLPLVGALGVAGRARLNSPAAGALAENAKPCRLAPQNRPVPFRGVSMRPPELLPYATGDEQGPVEKFAVTARLSQPQRREIGGL